MAIKTIGKKRTGYMIYSVGRDCKDDGGVLHKRHTSRKDYIWAVLR